MRTVISPVLSLALGGLVLTSANASAQQWPPVLTESQVFSPSDWEAGDSSQAVDVDGDDAVFGSGRDDDLGEVSGSSYFLRRDSTTGEWEQLQKVTASDGDAFDLFGDRVALQGRTALISAIRDEQMGTDAGSVYVFERQTNGLWVERQKLLPLSISLAGQPFFGYSIALSGDTAMVGEVGPGRLHVFKRHSSTGVWQRAQIIVPSNASPGFGSRMAIHGTRAVVSAYSDNVYFFELNVGSGLWEETQSVAFPFGAGGIDGLGIHEDTVAIGFPAGSLYGGAGTCLIYVIDAGQWVAKQMLFAPGSDFPGLSFGGKVAINNGRVFVTGQVYDWGRQAWVGKVWTYQLHLGTDTWEPIQVLLPSLAEVPGVFGTNLACSDDYVFVCGPVQTTQWADGTYIFNLHELIGIQEVTIDIKPGSFPNSINLGSNGVVPLAILGTTVFNVATIDPSTIKLASSPVRLRGNGQYQASYRDVNGDSILDLVVQVETEALVLSQADQEAVLFGMTLDGRTAIRGVDTVRIVPE